MEYELYLAHHGVKGMKWGVRKAPKESRGTRIYRQKVKHDEDMIRYYKKHGDALDLINGKGGYKESLAKNKAKLAKYEAKDAAKMAARTAKAQKKWDKAYKKNYFKAYNSAADYANDVLIPQINKKYSKIIKTDDWADDPNYGKYMKEYETRFNEVLNKKLTDLIGERPK